MKAFKIILCIFIILCFASCGKSEFMDLSGFVYNYNHMSSNEIFIYDFTFQDSQNRVYTAVLGNDGNEILISLTEGEIGTIESCQVILIKEKGKNISAEKLTHFRDILNNTLFAFCSYNKDECDAVTGAFELDKDESFTKTGELTLNKDNYHFVYYSTEIISEVIIYNTYLCEIETTEKPVSKPYYAENFQTIE